MRSGEMSKGSRGLEGTFSRTKAADRMREEMQSREQEVPPPE